MYLLWFDFLIIFHTTTVGSVNGEIRHLVYRKSTGYVKLMTVFYPFSFKIGLILSAPHHLPPGFGWVVQGYIHLQLVFPHLILNPSFVSFYCLGFTCAVLRRDCTKAIIPIPLLSVVICFATSIWCLRVLIFYYLVPIWCFWLLFSCIIKVVSCFHTCILLISFKIWFEMIFYHT